MSFKKKNFNQATQQVLPRCGGLELTEGLGLDSWYPVLPYLPTGSGLRFHSIHHQVLEIPSRLVFALLKKKDTKYFTPPPSGKRENDFLGAAIHLSKNF
jgi:hypothetical protein